MIAALYYFLHGVPCRDSCLLGTDFVDFSLPEMLRLLKNKHKETKIADLLTNNVSEVKYLRFQNAFEP